MLPNFSYLRARTVDEAAGHAAAPGARLMAGGTDLLGCLRDEALAADQVVSLGGLADLKQVRERDGGLELGALVTIAQVAAHPRVRQLYPVLAQAAAAVASPQLRNQGTLGGNLCQKPRCWYWRGGFPCVRRGGGFCSAQDGQNQFHCVLGGDVCVYVHPSDTAPALLALDAAVTIRGPRGGRTVPLAAFHVKPEDDPTRETVLAPGEIVTAVRVPAPPAGARGAYRKVRTRGAWDFALVATALLLAFDGGRVRRARVALGGVAPVPWRSPAAEAELEGRALTPATAARAAAAALADARPLAHNGAKVAICRDVLAAELAKLA